VAEVEPYLHAKLQLDLSNRFATITIVADRTVRQDRQDNGTIE